MLRPFIGLLFKMNDADVETDDNKTISKTTTQFFQPRNMLKCQLIPKKKPTSLFAVLKRSPLPSFGDYFCKVKRGLLFEIEPTGLLFDVLRYSSSRNGQTK